MIRVRISHLQHLTKCLMCALVAACTLQSTECLSQTPPSAPSAEEAYRKARASYDRLAKGPGLRNDRREWLHVIGEVRAVYLRHPEDLGVAPKALYLMGRCYEELYGYSGRRADLEEAIERFEVLIEGFPKERLADDALHSLGRLHLRAGEAEAARGAWTRIVREYPQGDMVQEAKRALMGLPQDPARAGEGVVAQPARQAEAGAPRQDPSLSRQENRPKAGGNPSTARVLGVRHWSAADYTRVVVDTSEAVSFTSGFLPADKDHGLPRRLYLDLSPAFKGPALSEYVRIDDGLLRGIRVGQFQPRTVRLAFELGLVDKNRVFYLEDPFRVVVDVFGEGYSQGPACSVPAQGDRKESGKDKPLSLAQQLGLCVRRIVVDAGHGGKDPGAIGPSGLREKDVVLKVAHRLAALLQDGLGCEVVLTRTDDRFLPLEQRTAIANARKADLFVSIHANSAPRRGLEGVETYFLNLAVDEDAMRVAAQENATSTKRISDLQKILSDLMRNSKIDESERLAESVQEELVSTLRRKYPGVKHLGVKQAPFFVLLGARMPAVLAEISFISNRKEEGRLRDGRYLDHIAAGILDGIRRYAKETEMAYVDTGRPLLHGPP